MQFQSTVHVAWKWGEVEVIFVTESESSHSEQSYYKDIFVVTLTRVPTNVD